MPGLYLLFALYYQNDKIFLEDESGRIELICEDSTWATSLVTGVSLAVLGLPNENGQLQVGGGVKAR